MSEERSRARVGASTNCSVNKRSDMVGHVRHVSEEGRS